MSLNNAQIVPDETFKAMGSLKLNTSLEQQTVVFRAFADSVRTSILRVLESESFGVLELSRLLDIRQSALSHHLKTLTVAGLVAKRREGNSIFYRRAFLREDDPYVEFKRAAFNCIDSIQMDEAHRRRLDVLEHERSELSLNFFKKNAEKFAKNQELIVERSQYSLILEELISSLNLPFDSTVVEIGPGEGFLLVKLAQVFNQVIGIDNSAEMLSKAKESVSDANLDNVTFIHGDANQQSISRARVNLVVMDMVLHHLPSPANIFGSVADMLNPLGYFLAVDLAQHDQGWVCESCGDLWLGFDEFELENWAVLAGLERLQSVNLALKNGFQVQISLFRSCP
ncbi:metalloregulator ArsR/SmtB family transcription factor [Gammaproteobacteria bacterium]|nr:metalloregulator ArsR/SmtB family transcription factor [Gammaproteobacteria bacterium]MDB2444744.1 metalloregulator ArsR/SmtB family transcription factor [Gammaproteobacteria bacterium]